MRGALGLALALALSACTLALPGVGGGADGASPLAAEAIAVTPLDTPADPVPAAGPDPAAGTG
ncbi:MAG: hypothetical protein IE927_13800, partial [Rhodobacterales bacterium]|nr:hypothetical protein [Rhodobacterales bacterium]